MTTSHPTVIFGAYGNSGDKRLKEYLFSRRKGYKVPEIAQKIFYDIFGSTALISRAKFYELSKTLILCGFRAFLKIEKTVKFRFDHNLSHN